MKTTKDKIESKELMTIWVCGYDDRIFEEPHLLYATKVEFEGNHLMFYLKKELVFKVWLKLDKYEKFKDIDGALEDSKIKIVDHQHAKKK